MFDYLQKFNNLPENLRNSVSSEAAMAVISELEKKYKIDLASTVMKVMIKSVPLTDLPTYFVSDFSLNAEEAKKLTADLKEKLFFTVANYLGYNPSYSTVLPKMTPVSNLATEIKSENDYYLEADKIIKNSGVTFTGSELNIRLRNILLTYLKGVRSRVDVRLALSKDIISGGLGLSHQVIDKIFKLGEGFVLKNNHQSKEINPVQPKREINKEALEKVRQAYEKNEPLKDAPYNLQEAIKNKQLKEAEVKLNLPLNDDAFLPAPKLADKKLLEAPDKKDLISVGDSTGPVEKVSEMTPPTVIAQNNQVIKKVADDIKEVLKITPLPAIKRQEVPEEPKKTEFKINRPPEKKPSVVAKILKPLEESKKEVVASSQALEEIVKPQSIIAKRNEVVLETQNNTKKQTVLEKPQPPKNQPLVSDIQPPRTMGPLDELRYLDVTNFRRLGASPLEATAKVEAKIKLLEKDGYDLMINGVLAWRDSLVNSLYVKMGQEALNKEITLKQCADNYQKAKASNFLFWEEIEAIIALNNRLMF